MTSPAFPSGDVRHLAGYERPAQTDSARDGLQRRLEASLRRLAVECRIEEDAVTLSGIVASYYEKQLAQEIVMKLGRTLRVKNRCEVRTNTDPVVD